MGEWGWRCGAGRCVSVAVVCLGVLRKGLMGWIGVLKGVLCSRGARGSYGLITFVLI